MRSLLVFGTTEGKCPTSPSFAGLWVCRKSGDIRDVRKLGHLQPCKASPFQRGQHDAMVSHMKADQNRSFARRGSARAALKHAGPRKHEDRRLPHAFPSFHTGNGLPLRAFADRPPWAFVLSRTLPFSTNCGIAK
jgi:hypothetical protein